LARIAPTAQSQLAAAFTANLSSDTTFAILSNTYTNIAATTINGDAGYTTGPSVVPTINGTTHMADGAYTQAGTDEASALGILNAESCDFNFGSATDLSLLPQPLTPGVYCVTGAASIGTKGITLTNNGIYLFRITGALTTVANSIVTLAGGASACNVFWTPTATTLGANSIFAGTDIDDSGITVGNAATWTGRALAYGGTVTTDTDTITAPGSCTAPVTPAPATLHVIKLVVNGISGAAVASNFLLHVKLLGSEVVGSPANGTSTPGTLYSLSPGTYVVSEDASSSYTESFTGDCDSSGNIPLASGDNKICTIVNTDIPIPVLPSTPTPSSTSNSSASGGGSSNEGGSITPLIGILKVPTPLTLPGGPGSVTYNYTVWNVGRLQTLNNVTVTDDKCSPVTLISGDTNNNGKLDPSETWKYSCTTTLSTTTTNTAVATGYSSNQYQQAAIAAVVATVVVGAPVTPPLIDIVKVPSRLTPFPYGGGDVTYTYTVTNPGTVPLSGVTVTDNKCAPVSGPTGDTNGNGLLDSGETWTYTCETNVRVSTRNIATARGSADGFDAVGYAFATVLVSAPSLPNTGFPPEINQK
jgi:hypothetical protein